MMCCNRFVHALFCALLLAAAAVNADAPVEYETQIRYLTPEQAKAQIAARNSVKQRERAREKAAREAEAAQQAAANAARQQAADAEHAQAVAAAKAEQAKLDAEYAKDVALAKTLANNPKKLLRQLKKKGDKKGVAKVLQHLAAKAVAAGKLRSGISYLRQAIGSGGLSRKQVRDFRARQAQLAVATGDATLITRYLGRWLQDTKSKDAQAWMSLALSYDKLKKPSKALANLKQAQRFAKPVPEQWYEYELSLTQRLGDKAGVERLLKRFILRQPDAFRWREQLAAIHIQNERWADALAIYEVAYQQQQLGKPEQKSLLLNLLLRSGAEYRAAKRLQQWLEAGEQGNTTQNWKLLSSLWLQTREYAKAAAALKVWAQLSGDVKPLIQLGQAETKQANWQAAADAYFAAMVRGRLSQAQEGRVLLGLGFALHQLEKLSAAKRAFAQAAANPATELAAQPWVDYFAAAYPDIKPLSNLPKPGARVRALLQERPET